MSSESSTPEQAVLLDPTTSRWLRDAVQSAFDRDPVDALNDALALADLLELRLRNRLGLPGSRIAQKK